MAGCRKKMEEYIPKGYDYKRITVRCGSTSPTGAPWLCEDCEKVHGHRDWRWEAIMNGENFDDDY